MKKRKFLRRKNFISSKNHFNLAYFFKKVGYFFFNLPRILSLISKEKGALSLKDKQDKVNFVGEGEATATSR